jgi:hypothetical protein
MEEMVEDMAKANGWKALKCNHPDMLRSLTKNDVVISYFKSGTLTVQGKGIQKTIKHATEEEVREVLTAEYPQVTVRVKKIEPSNHQPRHVKAGNERGSYAHSFMKVLMQMDKEEKRNYDDLADEAVAAADALIDRLKLDL